MEVPLKPEHLKQTQHCKSTISSVQFSYSVVYDSLRCYGLQHARPPCPLLTPRVYSNSCPLSWWCHPIISSSVIPFSSRLQSSPAWESSNESVLCIKWSNYWSSSFNISPSNEYSGLISLTISYQLYTSIKFKKFKCTISNDFNVFNIISELLLGTERTVLEDLPAGWQSRRTWAHCFVQKHQNHNCWTTIYKTTTETYWNLPKKIPYTQRQRRCNEMITGGTIMIKSSPYLPGGQPTNWKIVIPQKFSYRSESPEPTAGFQALESDNGGEAPRETDFEDQWNLTAGIPQGWGKQKLHS